MPDVELVIKIPQKWLDDMVKEEFTDVDELCAVVQHGIQLPKGHRALKDTDAILRELSWVSSRPVKSQLYMIKQAETIIEADKESGKELVKNDRLTEIKDLAPGTTVEFGEMRWTILDKCYPTKGESQNQGVLCIAEDIAFRKAFDEDKCSNWAMSSLRKFLNGDFKTNLAEGIKEKVLLPFKRDLTSDDGLKDYGVWFDTISLISCDEYRRYRPYINAKDGWWWTLTPFSGYLTPFPGYSGSARLVSTGGSLDYGNSSNRYGGVVPVLCINPSYKVEVIKKG